MFRASFLDFGLHVPGRVLGVGEQNIPDSPGVILYPPFLAVIPFLGL